MSILPCSAALPKEQLKALAIFKKYRSQFQNLAVFEQIAHRRFLPTNFVATSWHPFDKSHLPKEATWDWAQSNSRVRIAIDEQTTVTFRKLNPRRKTNGINPPSYKVWLYEISVNGEKDRYFLWCEKGSGSLEAIVTEIGYIFPQSLSIIDFSFLAPFVDRQTALEFGWIESKDENVG